MRHTHTRSWFKGEKKETATIQMSKIERLFPVSFLYAMLKFMAIFKKRLLFNNHRVQRAASYKRQTTKGLLEKYPVYLLKRILIFGESCLEELSDFL